MVRFEKPVDPWLKAAMVLCLAVVFGVDLLTPQGVAESVFYLVPVAFALYVWRPRTPLIVALASTVLVAVGLVASPRLAHYAPWIPLANRVMVIAAIWFLASVARHFIRVRLELREKTWVRTGQGALAGRMQGEQTLAALGDQIVRFVCEYLEAPVGALYAVEENGTCRRQAAYAGAGGGRDVVVPGVGLAGQALKDRRMLCIQEVPEGYLPVSSALGEATPRALLVAPLLADNRVQGVLELGFLRRIGRPDLDLVEASSEAMAIALRSAQYRTQLEQLLEETRRQAEELQTQQEELRVANEELEEQGHALRTSQARLEAQQAELEETNAQLEEQAQALELQRDDLTRTQATLTQKAEELARANQYKSEFLANMSHELRTPLNSALILAELLAQNKDGNLSAEQVRYAATIQSAGNDLLALINDILDLSRIEAGRVELHPEPLELPALLGSLRKTFEPLALQKRLALELNVAADAPERITTDPLRLEQILRNLLANALKFTERGRVSLRVGLSGADRIAFAVEDTGIGIPESQRTVIFGAFCQANGSLQRRHGGTGLGLTISGELARRLGGAISVESVPGTGSTFTLVIPVDLAVREGAPALAATPPPSVRAVPPSVPREPDPGLQRPAGVVEDDRARVRAGGRTLLIIEDDPGFALVLRDLVREREFHAVLAATAREGLDLARELRPDGVFLDVNLPDGSGLVLLEQLKSSRETRHIPVHIISVLDYAQKALELGAVGYAVKPVGRDQLVGAIERLAEKLAQKLRRILLVEDVEAQREGLEVFLRTDGVEIVSAGTGAEALRQLESSTFDCMVLDLGLPDMSGYDVLERMSQMAAFSCPPVVVYTGHALSAEEEQRLRRYASSVIIKGARSPDRLLDELSLFLHQVEADLPAEKQRLLRAVRQRDALLEGRRVLVVEDDARNIFALSSVLEPKGVDVCIARNGREALEFLDGVSGENGEQVDLVLMDVMMPVMDGLSATREIRRCARWAKLPIIALTAKAMPDDRQRCLEAGANDYVSKPFDVERLVSLIKVWLPKASARA